MKNLIRYVLLICSLGFALSSFAYTSPSPQPNPSGQIVSLFTAGPTLYSTSSAAATCVLYAQHFYPQATVTYSITGVYPNFICNFVDTQNYVAVLTSNGYVLTPHCPTGYTYNTPDGMCYLPCVAPAVQGATIATCTSPCPTGYMGSGISPISLVAAVSFGLDPTGMGSFTGFASPAWPHCEVTITGSSCAFGLCYVDLSFDGVYSGTPAAIDMSSVTWVDNAAIAAPLTAETSSASTTKADMAKVMADTSALNPATTSTVVQEVSDASKLLNFYGGVISSDQTSVATTTQQLSNDTTVLNSAADALVSNPTPANLVTYNSAVVKFNTSSAAAAPPAVSLNNDVGCGQTAVSNAQTATNQAAAIIAANAKLVTDLGAVAALPVAPAYDSGQKSALTAGVPTLATTSPALTSTLATTQAALTAATTALNSATQSIASSNASAGASGQMVTSSGSASKAGGSATPPTTPSIAPSVGTGAGGGGGGGGAASGVTPTVPASGSGSGGSGSGGSGSGITFPTDYARQGEAMAAAASAVANLLQTAKLDDPEVPDLSTMPSWTTAFDGLKNWALPSHTSICPTSTIDLSSIHMGVLTMNSQCTIAASSYTIMQVVMLAVYAIISIFIILGA